MKTTERSLTSYDRLYDACDGEVRIFKGKQLDTDKFRLGLWISYQGTAYLAAIPPAKSIDAAASLLLNRIGI